MACSNCYSGCGTITSDKCVKYTGVDVPILGIKNGDSLNFVVSVIQDFLTKVLDGTAIEITIPEESLCTFVSDQFADCEVLDLPKIIDGIVKAACALDTRVTTLENDVGQGDPIYTPGCVDGIDGTEGTGVVLQATINELCALDTTLANFILDVTTNYVRIEDINTYIDQYFANIPPEEDPLLFERNKMVPYTVVEYYGPLNVFDATGAGIGSYGDIYLCNGNNGTPDKRGRIPVGTTSGMGGGAFDIAVDPAQNGNPNYNLQSTFGSNAVALTEAQLPTHTHPATVDSAGIHGHYTHANEVDVSSAVDVTATNAANRRQRSGTESENYAIKGSTSVASVGLTNATGDHVHNVSIATAGQGETHSNIPPVLACHYIMYIPPTP